ncbi:MAG: periplasmic divalent cation tolerance protein [Euryarchaeota archaeon]|nr:periplasmic divalent cation tolerance protein [Euryarchaeota archaeon]
MSHEGEFVMVFCTTAPSEADGLARVLVEERLAACVNIEPVRSCYMWAGKVNMDGEALLIIKTTWRGFEPLKKRIREMHSYSVPEIIAVPVVEGHQAYLDWLAQSVSV